MVLQPMASSLALLVAWRYFHVARIDFRMLDFDVLVQ